MDMITQIEMRDAVSRVESLKKRLLEVAMCLAEQDEFFEEQNKQHWLVKRFHVSEATRAHGSREATSSVTVQLGTVGSKTLKKLGYPNWEDFEDEDNYCPQKTFTFPTRYIYTTGWEDEVAAQNAATRLWWKELKVSELTKAVESVHLRAKDLDTELSEALAELAVLREGR